MFLIVVVFSSSVVYDLYDEVAKEVQYHGTGMTLCQGPVYTLMNKYQEFYQIFSLKQLITCAARVSCSTSSLIDHMLPNSTEKIFQSGIIERGMSYRQLMSCTRKVIINLISITMFFLDFLSTTQLMCLSKNCKKSISQIINIFLV